MACGIAPYLAGEAVESVASGIDCYSIRQPLGVSLHALAAACTGCSMHWLQHAAPSCHNLSAQHCQTGLVKQCEVLQPDLSQPEPASTQQRKQHHSTTRHPAQVAKLRVVWFLLLAAKTIHCLCIYGVTGVRWYLSLQLPCDGAAMDVPPGHRCWQHLCAQAQRKGPRRGNDTCGAGTASRPAQVSVGRKSVL